MGEAKRRREANPPNLPPKWCEVLPAGAVEEYRAPADSVALTLDIHGHNPSTIQIPAADLAGVLDRVGARVNGMTYQQVLRLLAAAIEAADAGQPDAGYHAGLIGFWLACNHSVGGTEMRERLADAIAIDGRAHITLNASPERGIAFALSDKFVDLDQAAARAREAGVGAFASGEPRRRRPGGQA